MTLPRVTALLLLLLPSLALSAQSPFQLSSPVVSDGGALPAEFTGDGSGSSPPLRWSGVPSGTKSLALIMHHVDPQGLIKEYWNLYNLPASATGLASGQKDLGEWGKNNENDLPSYAPPMSKGPSAKTDVLTLCALSSTIEPAVPSSRGTRQVLLDAMRGRVLAEASLSVVYTRPESVFSQKRP